ncbi:MAG: MFS transporter, partial [Candidatus Binatia bacterium]
STDLADLSRAEQQAILTVTCLAAFLFFNSFGSIGVALPLIQQQFGNSLSAVQWVSLMGVVTISSLSFCFGRAGSIFGQRRLYKIGVALYAAGAGLGAIAPSFAHLLLARAVMAIGLAMALPMSTAILANSFHSDRRGQALGFFASAIAVGRMTGPTVGGFLIQLGGWTWIFWMNFIVGIAVTAAVMRIFRGPGKRQWERFDIWGSLALLIGYPALLVGLTFGANLGWTSAQVLCLFLTAAIALASFVWIELHTPKPLVDLDIFKKKQLAAAMATLVLASLMYSPIALCAPIYLQNVLGSSAVVAGITLGALPLSTALASPLSGRMADRFNAMTVVSVGLAIIVAGIFCYGQLEASSTIAEVVGVLVLIGTGIGFFTPANQKVAFAAVSHEDFGVLAAMLSSFATAAGAVGTTFTVALIEVHVGQKQWTEPAALASAQQFAFAWLVAVGLVAVVIAIKSRAAHR